MMLMSEAPGYIESCLESLMQNNEESVLNDPDISQIDQKDLIIRLVTEMWDSWMLEFTPDLAGF